MTNPGDSSALPSRGGGQAWLGSSRHQPHLASQPGPAWPLLPELGGEPRPEREAGRSGGAAPALRVLRGPLLLVTAGGLPSVQSPLLHTLLLVAWVTHGQLWSKSTKWKTPERTRPRGSDHRKSWKLLFRHQPSSPSVTVPTSFIKFCTGERRKLQPRQGSGALGSRHH